MSEISTKHILDGITLALRVEYPDCGIYDGEVQQGLLPGDFNVILVTASQQQIVGERYRRTPLFDVLYYPKGGNEECYAVADRLCMLLQCIRLPGGDLLRGRDMDFDVVDDVLHFRVRYPHFVRPDIPPGETMDSLTFTQGEKKHEQRNESR